MHRPRLPKPGFTLVELLLVLIMIGIVLSIAVPRISGLGNELRNATSESASFLRQTRSAALSSTSAYRVVVVSNTRLRTEFAPDCAATTWQPDTRLLLNLREGVVMEGAVISAGNVLACIDSRGVANASPSFVVRDRDGNAQSVQLFLGGAVTTAPAP